MWPEFGAHVGGDLVGILPRRWQQRLKIWSNMHYQITHPSIDPPIRPQIYTLQKVSQNMNIQTSIGIIYCNLSFFNAWSCLAASHSISFFTFAIFASFFASSSLLISESISNSWKVNNTTTLTVATTADEKLPLTQAQN